MAIAIPIECGAMDGPIVAGSGYQFPTLQSIVVCSGYRLATSLIWPPVVAMSIAVCSGYHRLAGSQNVDRLAGSRIYCGWYNNVYQVSMDTFHNLLRLVIIIINVYRWRRCVTYCSRQCLSVETFHSILRPAMYIDIHFTQFTATGHIHP